MFLLKYFQHRPFNPCELRFAFQILLFYALINKLFNISSIYEFKTIYIFIKQNMFEI
jgi:hypothetical protein